MSEEATYLATIAVLVEALEAEEAAEALAVVVSEGTADGETPDTITMNKVDAAFRRARSMRRSALRHARAVAS